MCAVIRKEIFKRF